MAFTPGQKLPESLEELDTLCAGVYIEGQEAGKVALRKGIKEFLLAEFFNAKGNERRADPENPKIQAVNAIMERLYRKFEDGSL